jgi:serpin B
LKYRAVVIALAVAGLSACGGGSSTSVSSSTSAPVATVAQSPLARNVNPQMPDTDITSAVAGNTTFAINALRQFDQTGGENTVFSPYSITQAMAMMAVGAKGNTLSEIQQALSFSLPVVQLPPALNAIDLQLAAKTSDASTNGLGLSPSLSVVNDVWAQSGFTILPSFLDTIAVNFGGGVRLLDFVGAPGDSRDSINSYIAQHTNDRITDLMPSSSITFDTRLVLTNAVWFKANWQFPFHLSNTRSLPFAGYSASPSTVPFMFQQSMLQYAQSGDYQAVDLPYVGGKISMLVVMPTPGTFDTFLSGLTSAKLGEIANNLSDQTVALSLPKFKLNTSPKLVSALQALGMRDAFDAGNADFSGIDGRRDLFINAVEHKAYISVEESGTEAAAATGIGVQITSIIVPIKVVPFIVDHSFLFILRDRETGLVLFMGKVVSL